MSYIDLGLVAPPLNDTAAAAANTTKIQAALTAAGKVQLIGSGTCWISAPLIVSSNTKLFVDPNLTIKNVSGVNDNVFKNYAYASGSFTNVTVSWTSGITASVAWTGHNKAAGQSVVIKGTSGTTDSAYSGVFRILSVTDADNFVVELWRLPAAAASGTIQAKLADSNILIDFQGGSVDWNTAGNNVGGGPNPAQHGIVLAGVDGLQVRNLTAQASQKYSLCVGALRDFVIDGVRAVNHGSDIVKVYGPALNGSVSHIKGTAGDDPVSVQTKEPLAFAGQDITGWGDCLNVTIDGVNVGQSSGSTVGQVSVYPSTSEIMDGIELKNITIRGPGAIKFSGRDAGSIIKGVSVASVVRAVDDTNNLINVATNCTIDRLAVDDVRGLPGINAASSGTLVQVSTGNTIGLLDVSRIDLNITTNYNAVYVSGGTIGEVNVRDSKMFSVGGSTGTLLNLAGGTVSKVNVSRNSCHNLANVVQSSASGSPTIVAMDNDVDACRDLVRVTTASTVVVGGNECRNGGLSLGLVAISGAITVEVNSLGGNTGVASGSFLNLASGPTVNVRGWDIKHDISALARFDGGYCYNTNTALGTLGAAGLVMCQGTAANSWRLLGDPTKQY